MRKSEAEFCLKFLAHEADNLRSFYHNACSLRLCYGYRYIAVLSGNKITEVQIVCNHTTCPLFAVFQATCTCTVTCPLNTRKVKILVAYQIIYTHISDTDDTEIHTSIFVIMRCCQIPSCVCLNSRKKNSQGSNKSSKKGDGPQISFSGHSFLKPDPSGCTV
jgi:hypothetical protein